MTARRTPRLPHARWRAVPTLTVLTTLAAIVAGAYLWSLS